MFCARTMYVAVKYPLPPYLNLSKVAELGTFVLIGG